MFCDVPVTNDSGKSFDGHTDVEVLLKDKKLYIHSVKMPVKKVGKGQFSNNEYSIDEEVTPSNIEEIGYDEMLKHIHFLPFESFVKEMSNPKNDYAGRTTLIQKLIYHPTSKIDKARIAIQKNAYNQGTAGVKSRTKINFSDDGDIDIQKSKINVQDALDKKLNAKAKSYHMKNINDGYKKRINQFKDDAKKYILKNKDEKKEGDES